MNSTRTRSAVTLDLLTLATLAVPFTVTLAMYGQLPDPMPTHFDLRGHPNGWMPRLFGAWLVSVMSLFIVALVRFGGHLLGPGWRQRLEASPVRALSLTVAALMAGVHVIVLRASQSTAPRIGGAVWVLLGGLFVVVGLLLPRTRRNPFFGVRTAFALASDENWAQTQSVGGYSMTAGGLVALVSGLFGASSVAIAAIMASVLAPAVWSWILARRGVGDAPRSP